MRIRTLSHFQCDSFQFRVCQVFQMIAIATIESLEFELFWIINTQRFIMYTKPSGSTKPVPITQAPRPAVPVPPGNPPPPQAYPSKYTVQQKWFRKNLVQTSWNLGLFQIDSWMTIPQNIPNCPSGLEYLSQLEQLLVRQEIDLAKLFHNFESNYEFTILNRNGQYVR